MHSIATWRYAQSPNYRTNRDRLYPYSEVPFIGQYKLVKVPEVELIDLVDYWGEGRIETVHGSSGFKDCYNVNHQYQLVSNGTDKGMKIPNRIPVLSYTDCNTRSYIKDNSVKTVTLMGAPINKSCSKDIARMVHETKGCVIVYGFDDNSADIKNLNGELRKKGLLHCCGYDVPDLFKEPSLFDNIKVYLSASSVTQQLILRIQNYKYEEAVEISIELKDVNEEKLKETIDDLLKESSVNTINYAYKLWTSEAKDMVNTIFDPSFKRILDSGKVKLKNKKQLNHLTITNNGDIKLTEESSDNAYWKFIPIWKDNKVVFKLNNVARNRLIGILKDDNTISTFEDSDDGEVLWSLETQKKVDLIVFLYNDKSGLYLLPAGAGVGGGDYIVDSDTDHSAWLVTS